jgi:hypothetical protein
MIVWVGTVVVVVAGTEVVVVAGTEVEVVVTLGDIVVGDVLSPPHPTVKRVRSGIKTEIRTRDIRNRLGAGYTRRT